ncbi:basic secretory protein-like protein [Parafilimonas sp.]|uniref:basic secretory protein-like protein n=1 Tax=Parafilimonas sp. TaxID=1969739 RepID=UPI0039E4C443
MTRKILFTVLFFIAVQTFGQSLSKDTIPAELYGEWYNKKNGDLLYGFYSKAVVCHEQVWKYDAVKKKGKQALIEISNDSGQKIMLKVEIKKSAISIGPADGRLTACANKLSGCHITHDLPEFTAPVFKEGVIYFSGLIADYNGDEKNFMVASDQLFESQQKLYLVTIQPNGYFSVAIPQANPTVLLAFTPVQPVFPYVIPGSHLFTIIKPNHEIAFAGDGAPLAREDEFLRKTNQVYLSDPAEHLENIKGLSPEQYKEYLLAGQRKADAVLDSVYAAKTISPGIYQMHKLDIKYATYQYLLSYNIYMKQADEQFKPVGLPASYFDFLRGAQDGETAAIAQAYPRYINALALDDNLNQLFAPLSHNKQLQDSLNRTGGTIESVASVYHALHHKWEEVNERQASLLKTIYEERNNDTLRKSFINDHQKEVDEILNKYRDISMSYIMIPVFIKYLYDSLGWQRGVTTDLAIAGNIARELIKENISIPDGYFDLKDSMFADPFVAQYIKRINDTHVPAPAIQTTLPGFVNNWSYIGKEGVVSNDTIHKNGYTLIFINKYQTFPDSTKAKMIDAFFTVYPEEAAIYNPLAPKQVTFVIDPEYTGVAASADSLTRFNPKWYEQNPNDIDVVTHEVMHLVQAYRNHYDPSWVTEGIADFVRYTLGVNNAAANWSLTPFNAGQSYTNSYRITARFFVWIVNKYDKGFVKKLDAAMRDNTYDDAFWKKTTGKSVDELWLEYAANPAIQELR